MEELGSLVIHKLSLQLPSLIPDRFRKLLGPKTAQRTLSPAQTVLQELTLSGCRLNGTLHWHLELLWECIWVAGSEDEEKLVGKGPQESGSGQGRETDPVCRAWGWLPPTLGISLEDCSPRTPLQGLAVAMATQCLRTSNYICLFLLEPYWATHMEISFNPEFLAGF